MRCQIIKLYRVSALRLAIQLNFISFIIFFLIFFTSSFTLLSFVVRVAFVVVAHSGVDFKYANIQFPLKDSGGAERGGRKGARGVREGVAQAAHYFYCIY